MQPLSYKKSFSLLISILFLTPALAIANNLSFRILNNAFEPVQVSIVPTVGTADSDCGGVEDVTVKPRSNSCIFTVHTNDGDSQGSVLLNTPSHQCVVNYRYHPLGQLGHMDKHSIHFSSEDCRDWRMGAYHILRESPNAEYRAPLDKALAIAGKTHAGLHPLNLARANCSGFSANGSYQHDPANCLVITPSPQHVLPGLALQHRIDQYEPMNRSQWLGTHNSTIARVNTSSIQLANMSFSDPNQTLSVTDQLNVGVRSIELDMLWHDELQSCHLHAELPPVLRDIVKAASCAGNIEIKLALSDIQQWLIKHPNDVVMIYIDENMKLAEHLNEFDKILTTTFRTKLLSKRDSTRWMSQHKITSVNRNAFPSQWISKADLIQMKRQVFVVSKNQDLSPSKFIFTSVANQHNQSLLLPYDTDMEDFNRLITSPQYNEDTAQQFKQIFKEDAQHRSIWRFNGDHAVVSYLASSDDQQNYNRYMSIINVRSAMAYPINMMSFDQLNGTCGVEKDTIDPRLAVWLWSWQPGYPVTNNNRYAYIDPQTRHFKNDMSATKVPYLLCYDVSKTMPWVSVENSIKTSNNIATEAQSACATVSAKFATPVTSYQMMQVRRYLNQQAIDAAVLVNYHNNGDWIANDKKALATDQKPRDTSATMR